MAQPQNWDRRTWTWGAAAGNFAGLTCFASLFVAHRLSGAGQTFQQIVLALLVLLCFFVSLLWLPGRVSAMARRYPFWWGLLPQFFVALWSYGGGILFIGVNAVRGLFWPFVGAALVAWLLSSGFVSLLRVAHTRRQNALSDWAASVRAEREAASSQEGVWPPPPQYRP